LADDETSRLGGEGAVTRGEIATKIWGESLTEQEKDTITMCFTANTRADARRLMETAGDSTVIVARIRRFLPTHVVETHAENLQTLVDILWKIKPYIDRLLSPM
jgi:hypothetical protein